MKSAAFGICVLGIAVATAGLGAAAEPRKGYLGIMVGPVSDEVRAQVELPARGGLTVKKLDPDGPARTAGVEVHDILVTFGEREVTSPLELAEHVADAGVGTKVRLSVLRGGKSRAIEVVLAERGEESDTGAFPGGLPGMAQAQAHAQAGGGDGAGPTISRQTMSMQSSSTSINGRTQSTLVSTDGDGTVEIREVNGKRTVTIRDAEGSEVHAGPLDSDSDREQVPEKFRDKVRKLEAQTPGGAKSSAKRRPRGAV
jgi:hypothetical protein